MRNSIMLKKMIIALSCLGVAVPHVAMAAAPAQVTHEGIAIVATIENVSLQSDGSLRGSIVEPNGQPVTNASVVVAQDGKVLHELSTDAQGQFEVKGLKSGTYQIASHAKAQNYRVWEKSAPADAKQGVVHVMPEGVARGQGRTQRTLLFGAVRHRWLLIAMGAATATAIIIGNEDNS